MIEAKVGNLLESIEDEQLDGIMNAANGKGPMGRGIAGAIKQYGGDEIQRDAYSVCIADDPKQGQAYSTIAGKLEDRGIKRIIHAVTMKSPGGYTSFEIIGTAFGAALRLAQREGIKRIGCTALGTGVGGLDYSEVGRIMAGIANEQTSLDIIFIDFNPEFIDSILLYLM